MSDAAERACEGRCEMLLFEGPPGSGRSRLLAEADAIARMHRMARLTVIPDPGERSRPAADIWSLVSQMPEEVRSEHAGCPDPGTAAEAVYAGLGRLAARDALALLVDDFEWLDGVSGRALAHLRTRLRGQRILFVLAGNAASPVRPRVWRDRLLGSGLARSVAIAPVSAPAAGELIASLLEPVGVDPPSA